jgi:hypothetical protein
LIFHVSFEIVEYLAEEMLASSFISGDTISTKYGNGILKAKIKMVSLNFKKTNE